MAASARRAASWNSARSRNVLHPQPCPVFRNINFSASVLVMAELVIVRSIIKARIFVGRALEYNLTTLRISRAYVSLLSRPEGDATAISLAWIGDFEIRMHRAPQTGAVEQPLFVIYIFDHDA